MTTQIDGQATHLASSQTEDKAADIDKCFAVLEGTAPLSSLTEQELSLVAPDPLDRLLVELNFHLTAVVQSLKKQPKQPHLST